MISGAKKNLQPLLLKSYFLLDNVHDIVDRNNGHDIVDSQL